MNIISITQKRINENSIGRFGLTKKTKYHTIIFLCLFFFEKKIYFSILNKVIVSGFNEEKVIFPRFGVWYPDA